MRYRTCVRSGITLTEILISIMIMGIGFVSLATLFPIGLLRMREATRDSRSTLLAESAAAEVNARDLLYGPSFTDPLGWYGARYGYSGASPIVWPANRALYPPSPWNKDFNRLGDESTNPGVYPHTRPTPFIPGDPLPFDPFLPGLPVAYDPLFWSTSHFDTVSEATPITPANFEFRFGSGMGFIRGTPAAHGLQRITNFLPYDPAISWPLTYSLPGQGAFAEQAGNALASLDDVIYNTPEVEAQDGSSLIPFNFDPTGNSFVLQRSWDFTWMLTARRVAAGDPTVYEADIVIFHKRPIGIESVRAPNGGTINVPIGERTVEAVWGHVSSTSSVNATGYTDTDNRLVLLRWDARMPDPNVRVGGYIADVTYERDLMQSFVNYTGRRYPGQRCHWYRVVQTSEAEPDPVVTNPPHRRMIVRVDSPLKAKTRLQRLQNNGQGQVIPVVPEAALINPYVVNVYSTLLYSRP